MPHIAGGEDPRHTGFQQKRIAFRFPVSGPASVADQVLPGVDKPGLIPLDEVAEKAGARDRADKNKERVGGHRFAFTALIVPEGNGLEVLVALDGGHFIVQHHLNVLCPVDLIDKVAGHAAVQ